MSAGSDGGARAAWITAAATVVAALIGLYAVQSGGDGGGGTSAEGPVCGSGPECGQPEQSPSAERPKPTERSPRSRPAPAGTSPDGGDADAPLPQDPVTSEPTGAVQEPVGKPLPVALSGSNVPEGVQLTPDGCVMGRCTFQSEENIPIGDAAFNTGWVVKCTIGCGTTEKADIDLQLGGKYRTLDATLGIDGQSGSLAGPVTIRIIDKTNGSMLRDYTFTSGKSVELRRFRVAGVTILRFEFLGPLSMSMAAVGSPIAYP